MAGDVIRRGDDHHALPKVIDSPSASLFYTQDARLSCIDAIGDCLSLK